MKNQSSLIIYLKVMISTCLFKSKELY